MEFRLIKIEEIEDLTLGSTSLKVGLSPIKYNYNNTGYHFDHTNYLEFILLDTKENRDFFLIGPEEIKELNLSHFQPGTLTKPNGIKSDVFRHIDYTSKIHSLKNGVKSSDAHHPLGKKQVDTSAIDDDNDLPF